MKRPYCIATLGTSLTADSNYGGTGQWQGMVGRALTGVTSRQVVVYNFGVPAQDSNQRLAEMGEYLPFRPDAIIVEFSMNDAYLPRSITTAQCKANALNIIGQFKAQNSAVKAFLMTMNPCVPGSSAAVQRPNLSLYTSKYREIAAENPDIPLIDNEPLWGVADYARIPDGVHPLQAVAAPIIVPNIVNVVRPFII